MLGARPPSGTGVPCPRSRPLVGDIGAAMQTVVRYSRGAVSARAHRRWRDRRHFDPRSGAGVVDVSRRPRLANACYNIYETADREWLALGALEPKFWAGFCERIERPDLAPRQFATGQERARVLGEVRRSCAAGHVTNGSRALPTPMCA